MIIIGIDPGLSGAIAILENNEVKKILEIPVMSEGKKNKRQLNNAQIVNLLTDNIKDFNDASVVVEQVNAMPGKVLPACSILGKHSELLKEFVPH